MKVAESFADFTVLVFGFQDAFVIFFGGWSSTSLMQMVGWCLELAAIALFSDGGLLSTVIGDLKIRAIAVISWISLLFESLAWLIRHSGSSYETIAADGKHLGWDLTCLCWGLNWSVRACNRTQRSLPLALHCITTMPSHAARCYGIAASRDAASPSAAGCRTHEARRVR